MSTPEVKELLSRNAFFSGLDEEHIEYLAERAKQRSLPKDTVLFAYGDEARHFYLVTAGTVSVEVAAIQGPALELQLLGPGAVLGWSWLIAPYRWTFQARAAEPAAVLEFDGARILARCEQDPAFGYQLVKRFSGLMSERLNFARQKMMEEWRPAGLP
ncbi:MAG TPA: cyclic nucleotide-binding domain-containing protein [Gammaproteobacteria bacterium]|nr:cyclic nucleotide-binding domain-containing protein [Gammaproteobacteria bacterium]